MLVTYVITFSKKNRGTIWKRGNENGFITSPLFVTQKVSLYAIRSKDEQLMRFFFLTKSV